MEDFDNSTTSTEQGLLQIKPETSRDEQLAFIDTLRDIQGTQNQEIQDTTHALGSDLPPQLGGINGVGSYWLDRYQTPQTESRIATLRTAAQSSALNTALNNYLERLQEDYTKAYRKANKRERNRAKAARYGTNNPSNNPVNNTKLPGGKSKIEGLASGKGQETMRSSGPGTTTVWDWSTDKSTGKPGYEVYNEHGDRIGGEHKGESGGTNKQARAEQYATGTVLSYASPVLGGIYKFINGLF